MQRPTSLRIVLRAEMSLIVDKQFHGFASFLLTKHSLVDGLEVEIASGTIRFARHCHPSLDENRRFR